MISAQTVKTCINFECLSQSKAVTSFVEADLFVLNYFNVSRTAGVAQHVCTHCLDETLDRYGRYCAALNVGQPIAMLDVPQRSEQVVVVDSSDEEENNNSIDNKDRCSQHQPLCPAAVLALIESELEQAMRHTFDRIDLDKQIAWSMQAIEQRIGRNEVACDEISAELLALGSQANRLYRSLYGTVRPNVVRLAPLDLNADGPKYGPTNPPRGPLEYPAVIANGEYFSNRNSIVDRWKPCTVLNVLDATSEVSVFRVV